MICLQTTSRLRFKGLLLVGVVLAPVSVAFAQSTWVEREFAAFRLSVDETSQTVDNTIAGGIDIRLAPGWQFYGEAPGKYGVPPVFDWSGSRNVAEARITWPEPLRFGYPGLPDVVTWGYKEQVHLPIRVTPSDPTESGQLRLKLEYAVCKEFCLTDVVEIAAEQPFNVPRTN